MRLARHVWLCLSARAVQVLLTYIGLTGRQRMAFRDLHSEALREAELAFARAESKPVKRTRHPRGIRVRRDAQTPRPAVDGRIAEMRG